MKEERPIIFNSEMVRAILEDKKTQTRRPIKPQPDADGLARLAGQWVWNDTDAREYRCPYGRPGDLLWVKETFATGIPGCSSGVTYRADHIDQNGDGPANPIKWRPSIHMPRWASRITLEITNVRVELLQDIPENDILAEGIAPPRTDGMFAEDEYLEKIYHDFINLWDSIYVKRGLGWDANPWVWVIHFRVAECKEQAA